MPALRGIVLNWFYAMSHTHTHTKNSWGPVYILTPSFIKVVEVKRSYKMIISYVSLSCYLQFMVPSRPLQLWLDTSLSPWVKGWMITHGRILGKVLLSACFHVIISYSYQFHSQKCPGLKNKCYGHLVKVCILLKAGIIILSRLWMFITKKKAKVFLVSSWLIF